MISGGVSGGQRPTEPASSVVFLRIFSAVSVVRAAESVSYRENPVWIVYALSLL